jgi:TonB-linked SusC/RagA family outer membrane protein
MQSNYYFCLPEASLWRTAFASLFLLLGLSLTNISHGQQTVSGTVTDGETGDPLPGVNIRVVNTDAGTVTNSDGEYELTIPSDGETLRFSFVGYDAQTVSIGNQTTINVTLQPATLTGNEVVVTGYSERRRADVTGSVDVADVENLQREGSELVTEQLQGQVSGVTINTSGQPGDQPQINIRGFNTFGNNQPLFVVDGVPTQDISFLNPNDVGSLQVLKDAGAASQYGARASNGVIVITTRQGEEDAQVNYNASVGYQVPRTGNVLNKVSPQEDAEYRWLAFRNSQQDPSHPIYGSGDEPDVPDWILPARAEDPDTDQYFLIPEYKDPSLLSEFQQFVRANKDGTNWYDELTEPAFRTQHNVSVGSNGDIGSYFASFSYTNQDGAVINTNLERYTVRANSEFDVSDNFRVGENISFTSSTNLQVGTLVGRNALDFAGDMHSIIPVRDIRGNFAGTAAPGLGTAQNPVALRERARNDDQRTRRLFGNLFAELDVLQNFTLRTSFGADIVSETFEEFDFPSYEEAQTETQNAFTKETRSSREWTFSSEINYDRSFGEHDISAVAATEAISSQSSLDRVFRRDYFSFDEDFVQLGTGSGAPSVEASTAQASTLFSLIGNVDYNYDNTYLLGLTVRRDGSSKFINNKWGTFPSVTAGVRLSKLSFFPDADWLTDLKLRGGYGVMGNQLNVDPANGFTLFGGSPRDAYYPIDGSTNNTQQGIRRTRIGNPDAQWETVRDINVGVDLAMLEGQLEASVELYRKEVEDLLFNPALPATAGAAEAPVRNVGTMRNDGLDVSLRGNTSITEDLEFNGSLNFTTYRNEIQSIAPGIEFFDVGPARNEVGHPLSSFFGYKVAGLWQSGDEIEQANQDAPDGQFMPDAAPGRFRYEDINGDGEITPEDRTHLGNPHPDFSYGLNLNLSYRNWSVSALLYGEQGGDIWDQNLNSRDFPTFGTAQRKVALYDSWKPEDRSKPRMEWTAENPDASVPIQERESFFSTNNVNNSYLVADGSYLRLKNLQVGYRVPTSLLQPIGGEQLRLYVKAKNLFTITPYRGLDPDIGATESAVNAAQETGGRVETGATSFGIDRGGFPAMKTYTVGVNLSF